MSALGCSCQPCAVRKRVNHVSQSCSIRQDRHRSIRALSAQHVSHRRCGYGRFASISATAEATTLPAHGVDFISAGQAFHWFDRERVGVEYARILKPLGWVVLIWNERCIDTTPFLRAYEQLLHTYSPEYAQVDHKQVDLDIIQAAFPTAAFRTRSFDNQQHFDLEGVKGLSISRRRQIFAGRFKTKGHEVASITAASCPFARLGFA
jgi:hypothetical protein